MGREARQQEGRDAHLEVARGALDGGGDFAGRLHGKGDRQRAHVESRSAAGVPREALHGERRAPQHVVQRARGRIRKKRAHAL